MRWEKRLLHASSKRNSFSRIENFNRKNEYNYLYKKDDDLEGDKTTDENEGDLERGNDFINRINFSRQRFNKNVLVNVSENVIIE